MPEEQSTSYKVIFIWNPFSLISFANQIHIPGKWTVQVKLIKHRVIKMYVTVEA